MADIFNQWEQWRAAYQRLSFLVRAVLVGLAFILGPLGVVAMFTPLAVLEVGSLLVFTSLTVLSFQFDWAYRLLRGLRHKLENARVRRGLLMFTVFVVLVYAVVIVTRLLGK